MRRESVSVLAGASPARIKVSRPPWARREKARIYYKEEYMRVVRRLNSLYERDGWKFIITGTSEERLEALKRCSGLYDIGDEAPEEGFAFATKKHIKELGLEVPGY